MSKGTLIQLLAFFVWFLVSFPFLACAPLIFLTTKRPLFNCFFYCLWFFYFFVSVFGLTDDTEPGKMPCCFIIDLHKWWPAAATHPLTSHCYNIHWEPGSFPHPLFCLTCLPTLQFTTVAPHFSCCFVKLLVHMWPVWMFTRIFSLPVTLMFSCKAVFRFYFVSVRQLFLFACPSGFCTMSPPASVFNSVLQVQHTLRWPAYVTMATGSARLTKCIIHDVRYP